MELVFEGASHDAIEQFVRGRVQMLLSRTVDIEELVLTMKISKALDVYDNPDGKSHLVVAKMWAIEKPMTAPKVGERVRFVYVECTGDKAAEKARPPYHVTERGARLDLLYYMNNKLKNPITSYLNAILGEERTERIFDLSTYRHEVGRNKYAMPMKQPKTSKSTQTKLPFVSVPKPSTSIRNLLDDAPTL